MILIVNNKDMFDKIGHYIKQMMKLASDEGKPTEDEEKLYQELKLENKEIQELFRSELYDTKLARKS